MQQVIKTEARPISIVLRRRAKSKRDYAKIKTLHISDSIGVGERHGRWDLTKCGKKISDGCAVRLGEFELSQAKGGPYELCKHCGSAAKFADVFAAWENSVDAFLAERDRKRAAEAEAKRAAYAAREHAINQFCALVTDVAIVAQRGDEAEVCVMGHPELPHFVITVGQVGPQFL